MKFKYSARTQTGELQTGFVDALTRESATAILSSHNLFILSVEEADRVPWYERALRYFNRVKLRDLMVMSRQFSLLLESKVSLADSIQALYRQTTNKTLKETIFEVSSDVNAGLSLSQAMERHPNIFSEFYVNMIRSAEITGRLEDAMTFLADYLDKEVAWRGRVKNAMIYPVMLIVVFVIVAIFLLTSVFPQIEPIFRDSHVALPFITQVFLSIGDLIIQWWWALIVVFALVVALALDYIHSDEGRVVMNELVMKLPVFGALSRRMYVARFSESVSILVRGGIPLTQAIEIAGRTIENVLYKELLHEIAERVKGGELFSALLAQAERYFPPLVGQMVAIGEGTGRLDEVLSRISTLYTREVNDTLDRLTELIQPVLILIIAVFVGILFASILVPIYNLSRVF